MTRLADVEATRILNGFQRDARAMLEQLLPWLAYGPALAIFGPSLR